MENAVFPVEMFLCILEEYRPRYHKDRYDDLKRFSTVCKAFAAICQSFLFQHMRISCNYESELRFELLATYFVRHPKLASHVQQLKLVFAHEVDGAKPKNEAHHDFTLPIFPHLTRLTIRGILPQKMTYQPDITRCNLQSRFLRHCLSTSRETLRKLSISFLDGIPMNLFHSFPRLATLNLEDCTLVKPSIDDTANISIKELFVRETGGLDISMLMRCPNLKSFDLHSSEYYQTKTRNIDAAPSYELRLPFRVLQKLSFTTSIDWRQVCALANAAGQKAFPALQDIVFRPPSFKDMADINCIFDHIEVVESITLEIRSISPFITVDFLVLTNLDLSRLVLNSVNTLKKLSLRWTVLDPCDSFSKKITQSILQLSQYDNKLESLSICLCYGYFSTVKSLEEDTQHWTSVINTLSDPVKFPCLKSITMDMFFYDRMSLIVKQDSEDGDKLIASQLKSMECVIKNPKVTFNPHIDLTTKSKTTNW